MAQPFAASLVSGIDQRFFPTPDLLLQGGVKCAEGVVCEAITHFTFFGIFSASV